MHAGIYNLTNIGRYSHLHSFKATLLIFERLIDNTTLLNALNFFTTP